MKIAYTDNDTNFYCVSTYDLDYKSYKINITPEVIKLPDNIYFILFNYLLYEGDKYLSNSQMQLLQGIDLNIDNYILVHCKNKKHFVHFINTKENWILL